MTEIRDLIEKAEKSLHTAEYILSVEDYVSCASRGSRAVWEML